MKGNMDLLSELEALKLQKSRQGLPCSVKTMLDSLNEKERKAVEQILEEHTYPINSLLKVLRNNNHNVKEKALYRHRRKECRCFL
jgi:hypothetical protein